MRNCCQTFCMCLSKGPYPYKSRITFPRNKEKIEGRFQNIVNVAFRKILFSKTTIFRKNTISIEMRPFDELWHVQWRDITLKSWEFNKFVRFSNILIFLELFTAQSKPSDATDFENQTLMLVELTTAAYHMADESFTQVDYINDVPGTFIIWHDKSLFLINSKVIQLIKMLLNEN